ncbi:3-oxoacyl-[acyl-carrier-protein] FabG [Cyphellophora attinorum]|uniref:3-oxoacyl-[acyl-carrier-protein] FabG n=1 Tax=Cyphellophora attinorum TaxID=1664694 RepID=A0A0N1GYA2_9EURO|nr:3-oxoacyl-[acyl-carrier-protein] FabG [Phialophora attinorum]KPI35650.1 3-oxoacyl-[acyl-carrier-protein] FabG [Phialophora attinorum]
MVGRLQDKVAIITGSSSGLGRAIAFAYIREGARVVCADLSPAARADFKPRADGSGVRADILAEREVPTHEALNRFVGAGKGGQVNGDAAGQGGEKGERAMFVKIDVTKAEEWDVLVKEVVGRWGRIDILINNAGISWESRHSPMKLHDLPEEAFDQTIAVNLKSVWLGCRAVVGQMLKQECHQPGNHLGWIINVSSIFGLVGSRMAPSYAASKGAVANLTRSLALDYAADRIHVNALNPGFVRTGIFADTTNNLGPEAAIDALHPFGGAGVPEDLAGPAVFLASADAQWVTGVNLSVDGGYVAQ